jgi:hypothetical protein
MNYQPHLREERYDELPSVIPVPLPLATPYPTNHTRDIIPLNPPVPIP